MEVNFQTLYRWQYRKHSLRYAGGISMKKGWTAGKIIAVILGSIAAFGVLWIALVISILQLSYFVSRIEGGSDNIYGQYQEEDKAKESRKNPAEDTYGEKDSEYPGDDSYGEKDFEYSGEDSYDTDEEYYDFANALRDDLEYSIEFKTSLRDDFDLGEGQGSAKVEFHYPVVMGNVKNLDGINQVIQEEIHIVEEHVASSVRYLTAEEVYSFTGEGYVTYMSEDILSVAYVEYGYLNGSYLESYIVSYNIDMQTGMVMNNTHLLGIDDKFSIDFRERCEKQNGTVDSLYYMSDQEITDYLTDEAYLIIFYTPLGMEVGFNFYDGWVTVTYKDYEKYQKKF